MDWLAFIAILHSTALWGAVSGVVSGVGAFLISLKTVNVSRERERIKLTLDASSQETAERAAFRATLMAELSGMRAMMKECETDKDFLRERLNTAEAQILVLKASNEIMEKWVAFFRDGIAPSVPPQASATHYGDLG